MTLDDFDFEDVDSHAEAAEKLAELRGGAGGQVPTIRIRQKERGRLDITAATQLAIKLLGAENAGSHSLWQLAHIDIQIPDDLAEAVRERLKGWFDIIATRQMIAMVGLTDPKT